MTDNLSHWVETKQGAQIPLIQLQDPTTTRGPGILIVTDDQRTALWSAANREHDRLQRGVWWDKGWTKVGAALVVLASVLGGVASVLTVLHR